jgi:hypothetical protein
MWYTDTSSFKKFLEFVYCTEISNTTSVYTTLPFEVVPFNSDTLLPTFVKLSEAFLKTFFDTSVGAFVTFAVTSLVLVNH